MGNQAKNEKHPFLSPTTPGLYITFRAYLIELICLNVNKKIGPRFWRDMKYWNSKFRREIKGVSNLGKDLDLADTLIQTAIISVIKNHNIKSLTAKKTVQRTVKLTNRQIMQIKEQRQLLISKPHSDVVDSKKNALFVDTGDINKLAKIKAIENG